mmetsp:Transcript_28243/g.65975  ORF Transcript_28243/g.65975 Transcript_28243/m.65975 type:complete len:526 (-) Transcript_28243:80-1657(-)
MSEEKKRERGVAKYIPNLYETPIETKAEVDETDEKVEIWWLTIPTIIIYVIAVIVIIVIAAQATRTYTVVCAGGKCGGTVSFTEIDFDSAQDLATSAARDSAGLGDGSVPGGASVTLDDYTKFRKEAFQKGSDLTCLCRRANVPFSTFADSKPKQNKLCEMMLDVFYDPLTAAGGATYQETPADSFKDAFAGFASLLGSGNGLIYKSIYTLCKSSRNQVDAFVDNFKQTTFLSPRILEKPTLEGEVSSRLSPITSLIAAQYALSSMAGKDWVDASQDQVFDINDRWAANAAHTAYDAYRTAKTHAPKCSCMNDWSCTGFDTVTGVVGACNANTQSFLSTVDGVQTSLVQPNLFRLTHQGMHDFATSQNLSPPSAGFTDENDYFKWLCGGCVADDGTMKCEIWTQAAFLLPTGECFWSGPSGRWTAKMLSDTLVSINSNDFEAVSLYDGVQKMMLRNNTVRDDTTVDFSAYIDQCAAESCSYTYNGPNDAGTVITQVMAQFALVQTIVTILFGSVIKPMLKKKAKR